jgi:hypothetical protein
MAARAKYVAVQRRIPYNLGVVFMRSAILALTALLVFAAPVGVRAASLSATPSNLSSVFGSAKTGDIISLAAGDYGTFKGGAKSGMVTLRAAAGTRPSMRVDFDGASFITLDGLTVTDASVGGGTHDVAIVNSQFTGMTTVGDGSTFANANILFDHDSFDGNNACDSCYEGRLTVRGTGSAASAPMGVKVSNSHFGNGGESDGVQIVGNATGVRIGPNNEFSGIKQGNFARHVDSIQLYGSSQTQIVGNYFHDNDTILMAPDGGDRENVTNNVMVGGGEYRPAVQFGHHTGSLFTHNTIKNIDVNTYVVSGAPDPNANMLVRDNVVLNGSLNGDGCQSCTVSYNLFGSGSRATGTNSLTGTPAFSGGAAPTTWAGWALKSGSPGKGSASDGIDRGINIGGVPATPGTPGTPSTPGAPGTPGTPTTPGVPPKPSAPSKPSGGADAGGAPAASSSGPSSVAVPATPRATSGAAFAVRWSMKPSKARVGAKVILTAPKTVAGGRKCLWTVARGVTRRGCQIAVRFTKAGRKRVTVRIADRSGTIVRGVRTITVLPRAKAAGRTTHG